MAQSYHVSLLPTSAAQSAGDNPAG